MATTTVGNVGYDRGQNRDEARGLAAAWGLPVLLGIALILTGVLALFATPIAGVAAMFWLGGLLIAGGVVEIGAAFMRARNRRPVLTVLAGVLSVVAGLIAIVYPVTTLAGTTLLVGGFLLGGGLFRAVTSAVDRYPEWGWDLAYGILTALLGGWVIATWPISSFAVIGTIVGVELVLRGGAWLGAGAAIRNALHRRRDLPTHDVPPGRVAPA